MAKGNQWFQPSDRAKHGRRAHAQKGDFKIPFKDRKAFMRSNRGKWVGKKKYQKYVDWCKRRDKR